MVATVLSLGDVWLLCICVACLTLQSFLDIRWRLLSDRVDVVLLCSGAMYAYKHHYLGAACLGAMATGLLLYALYHFLPGAMGFGDVKLMPCLAMWLDIEGALFTLWLAFCLGAVWGIFLLLRRGKGLTYHLPFGPFLCISMLISFLHGKTILALYYGLF